MDSLKSPNRGNFIPSLLIMSTGWVILVICRLPNSTSLRIKIPLAKLKALTRWHLEKGNVRSSSQKYRKRGLNVDNSS